MRAVALIDGEHYPEVVRDALTELPYEWVGAILVGLVAGALCCVAVTWKHKGGYDDALDVVGVHLVGGLVGTLLNGYDTRFLKKTLRGAPRRPDEAAAVPIGSN